MLVITTPTGHIGRATAARLLEAGEAVRVIVRDPERLDPAIRPHVEIVTGSHGDPAVLDKALAGADGLLMLVPPDFSAAGARAHYLAFAQPAAAAIHAHDVGHVVAISSAGHGWPEPAGLLSAAFAMDEALRTGGSAYRALSMPAFMENMLRDLPSIRDAGVLSQPYDPQRILPLVAIADIAQVAAGLLTDRSWNGQENLPVFGPDRLTPPQLAEVIAQVIGRPVTYVATEPAEVEARMTAGGTPARAVRDLIEMIAAQNAGIYEADLAIARPTPTGFRQWCETVLVPALG